MVGAADPAGQAAAAEEREPEEREPEEREPEEREPEGRPIPAHWGLRPPRPAPEARPPARRTVRRSDKLVQALSVPSFTLYNARSLWAKQLSLAEDMDMRNTDVAILTEVWEKAESKKHQAAIEGLLEKSGIKYVSTPRPGARRGGGTAIACRERDFYMVKLHICVPAPLEACFALLRPKAPTGKVDKFLCVSFYAPPRSRYNAKLAEFLVVTIGLLRTEHPGCRVILGGDRNDMKLDALMSLDPTLRQIVRGTTNKNRDKTLDVLITDMADLLQEPTILPPLKVDEGRQGTDSDHCGVECRPRTTLAPRGGQQREKVTVRRFPESGLATFGVALLQEQWAGMGALSSVSEMVGSFETRSEELVGIYFPKKVISVGAGDLPYFTEELRLLKRQRQRAYAAQGRRGQRYIQLREKFDARKKTESIKYREKLMAEVREGKRGSAYGAIRKLGSRPGEEGRSVFTLPAYVEAGLTPLQAANRLAGHFSQISQTVEPIKETEFHPALRQALEQGRASKTKPTLSQHQVYIKMRRANKPGSSVPGDVPRVIIKEFPYEYAEPATKIFNQMIQSSQWPEQWREEHITVIPKSKTAPPSSEDDLRNIAKTAWMSKLAESILADFLLPAVKKYIDPGQCGGFKGTSISHYLVRLLDFVHKTLDMKTPHAAILTTEDLSKAYNRGSHQLVIEDLHSMHVSGWLLALCCSYLTGRSMLLKYQGATSTPRPLPGGFGQGTWLGGFFFLIKFNGALLRPPVPRPMSGNKSIQVKYIDDASQISAINLKASLVKDPVDRPRPFNYHERTQTVLKAGENIVQEQLDRFSQFTEANGFVINSGKCYVMLFSRSTKYDFPPEFSVGGPGLLEEVKCIRILGIQVQSDLRWTAQVQQMVARATKTTWALRRMKELGVDQSTLVAFWKAEGRVHLEMCCPVWHSSITTAQARALDRAQRVAMAAITGTWAPSHSQQLSDLGLEELSARREQLCVRFARRTATKSRHTDLFTPAAGPRFPRGPQPGTRYQEVETRTATYSNSALPYLTRLLNGS
jgi:hypothetical protein